MKNKAFLLTFIASLLALTSRAEVLTETSEPFQFGSLALVPLSILALLLSAGLIVFFAARRRRTVEDK